MNLSRNFTLEEMVRSQVALRLGIDNTPPAVCVNNLVLLCTNVLEPVRIILGVPLHVDSGYRCPDLNVKVGGALDSQHVEGRAADVIPQGISLNAAFELIRMSAVRYDQLILECNAWIHLSYGGTVNRRETLVASGGPGQWTYRRVS